MGNKFVPLALASTTALLLFACTLAYTSNNPVPAPGSATNTQWLRVIVQFKQSVPYNSASWLADLSRQLGARIDLVTASSDTSQVYLVQLPPSATQAQMLTRLKQLPGVALVEVDEIRRALTIQ